jgi:hypothetical protein
MSESLAAGLLCLALAPLSVVGFPLLPPPPSARAGL